MTRHAPAAGGRSLPLRRVVAAASAAVLMLGLAACSNSGGGGGGDSEKKVALQLWDTDTRPDRTANLKALIAMFEKENPNITISYLGLPTDSYMQKLSTAIATKSTPDLVTPKASDVAALVAQNALAPLDDRLAGSSIAKKIDPNMLKSAKAAAPDDKLYLTPATALADAIYYRADWFQQAGLSKPATWDDFFSDASTLTDPSAGRFGYTIRGGAGFFSQFVQMVYPMAGVGTFFDSKGRSTLDSPAVVAATEKYVSLYAKDTAKSDLTADFKTMVAQFDNGGAAMLSHSIGSYPTHIAALKPSQVGVVGTFPADNGKTIVTGQMVTGFGMFKASAHQDAAWKFLEFTMSKEGNSFWAQKSGYLPGNTDVAKESWVASNPAMTAALDTQKAKNATVLQQPYYLPQFSAITTTDLLPKWQKVLQGDESAKAFLTDAATQLTAAQQDYLKRSKK